MCAHIFEWTVQRYYIFLIYTNKNGACFDFHNDKESEDYSSGSESGGYLLSHNKCSTIGVAELNDPVRNGKGWDLSAITT